MLYVFHVDTGTMMTFEMGLAIERCVSFCFLSLFTLYRLICARGIIYTFLSRLHIESKNILLLLVDRKQMKIISRLFRPTSENVRLHRNNGNSCPEGIRPTVRFLFIFLRPTTLSRCNDCLARNSVLIRP